MRKKVKLTLFIIMISIIALSVLLYNVLPNFKKVSQEKAFDEFEEDKINVIIDGERISLYNPILIENDKLYFPINFVKENISRDIFWDGEENVFTITNAKEMMRFKPDNKTYELNYKEHEMEIPIKLVNNILYIPCSLIKRKYNIEAKYDVDNSIVTIDDTSIDRVVGKVTKKKASVRTQPDIKEPLLEKIYKKDNVMTYGTKDGWTKVRTSEGNIGYVKENNIEYLKQIDKKPDKSYEPKPVKKKMVGDVVMAWDQIGKGSVLNFNSPKYNSLKGVNVLSPTWLEFKDNQGNLEDKSNRAYIDWAHSRGYQVWPLMSHNFSNNDWTHEILSSTEKRDRLIKGLLDYVKEYNIDGINIDIESLKEETGPYWVQFMSELYPIIKEEGIYVSTDVYVPSPWTIHYDRKEIAKVVDYLVIMAYDEHWSGSEEVGSVGSIPWVKTAIEETLEEVPEEKIILGVPFYSRLWKEEEEDGEHNISSRALGMVGIENTINENDVTPEWDDDSGQYYGEYEKDNAVYKMWIEDEDSMKERANFINRYDLGGIAGWKLGLEKPIIWDVIDDTLKQ